MTRPANGSPEEIIWLRGFEAGVEAMRRDAKKSYQDLKPSVFPITYYDPPKRSCSRCGISLDGVMGYVCNNKDCPTFLQVTC